MRYKYSDGGRAKSKRPKQKNDCSVRAYAIATGEDYDTVFDKLKKFGRKNNCGCPDSALYGVYGEKFYYAKMLNAHYSTVTVRQFLKTLKTGNYIIHLYDHVFAIKNGVIYDACKKQKLLDSVIYGVWIKI